MAGLKEKLLSSIAMFALQKGGEKLMDGGFESIRKIIDSIKKGDIRLEGPVYNYLRANKKTSAEAERIVENADKKRFDVFHEAFRLILEKWGFTNLVPLLDLWKHTGGRLTGILKPDPDILPGQSTIEFVTAIIMLMPDSWSHKLPIVKEIRSLANSETFLKIVEKTPGLGKSDADKIRRYKRLDDILKAFRIVYQEVVVGVAGVVRLKNAID